MTLLLWLDSLSTVFALLLHQDHIMKIKVDSIVAKCLPFTQHGKKAKQPVLKIIIGEFEAMTSRYELFCYWLQQK